MAKNFFERKVNRRRFIRDSAIIGAGLAGMMTFPKMGRAAAKKLRLITPEADPTQVKVWGEIFEAFAAKHPGIEVKGEYKKWDDITKKLAADIAVGSPPELVAGTSKPDFVAEQFKRGYCLEMSKVVDAIGRDDFYPSALQAWQYGGKQMAIPYGSQGPVLWYRKDIYAEKGLKPPVTWEDYMDAAEKTTDVKKGFYGAVFPYGRTWNTHLQVLNCIWSAGGFCFDEKLNVAFDSPETRIALTYYRDMARFSPPDAGKYGFRECSNAFVSGSSATTFYWGRVLSHLYKMAKDLVPKSGCVPNPRKKYTKTCLNFDEMYINKTPNTEEAIEFVKFFFQRKNVLKMLWVVPGHVVPTQKSLAEKYLEHPWLKENPDIAKALAESPSYAVAETKESPNHPFNYKMVAVIGNKVIPDCIQKIIIGKEPVAKAISWAHKKMVEVTKDIKA